MLDKFKIGHADNDNTGVTVILSEGGATGGVHVMGGAPATRETDLLKSGNTVQKINAVVLAGGSAYGLEAASGVMEYLREKGFGYDAGGYIVPIVTGACIYDLEKGDFDYPKKEMGYEACRLAKENNFFSGSFGGGKCATVGKILGMKCAENGGVGVAFTKTGGAEMAVITVVNALGDVVDKNGDVIAGAKVMGLHIGAKKAIETRGKIQNLTAKNTTISCILTNAKLTKTEVNRLCEIAHDGYAMAISPVHTMYDGDAIFGMASGEVEADLFSMCVAAPGLVAEAIRNAVKKDKKKKNEESL